MLLEIRLGDKMSVIVNIDRYEEFFEEKIPFSSTARVWKQEIYFETPIVLDVEKPIYRVDRGKVYYWRPGKALCLFYGYSQIYTEGIEVGYIVGPTQRLYSVEDGSRVYVEKHVVEEKFRNFIEELERLGYTVGTQLEVDGSRSIAATRYIGSTRIAFSVFVEEYGFHIESESIARYDESLSSITQFLKLKKLIERETEFARLDVSEDGFVVVTATSPRERFRDAVKDLEKSIQLIHRELGID